MVQILPPNPRAPSFTSQLGLGLGSGLGQGFSNALQRAQEEKAEQRKYAHQLKLEQQKEISAQAKAKELQGMKDEAAAERLERTYELKGEKAKADQEFLQRLFQGKGGTEEVQPGEGKISVGEPSVTPKEFEQKTGIDPKKLSNEDILQATAMNSNLGKVLQQQKDLAVKEEQANKEFEFKKSEAAQTKFQKEREYNTQFTKPVIDSANAVLAAAPGKKAVVNQWKRDIASGNTSGFLQQMVDKTGLEFWRTPEAARFKNAAKEYFVEGLHSLSSGTRPNMFIEQQLAGALPTIGRNVESGLTVIAMQELLDDLKEKKSQFVLDLAKEDFDKYGYEKKDLESRAQKMLEPYAEQKQKEVAYNIRKIHEDQLDDTGLANEIYMTGIPPQTPLTRRAMQILMIKNNDDVDAAMRDALKFGFAPNKEKK